MQNSNGPAERFAVLSLDGGGVRGIFTAALLAEIEAGLGRPVLDHFDLVVGTSTGGIIALGLGAGKSAAEIRDIYLTEMSRIFPRRRRVMSPIALTRAKYRSEGLRDVLQDTFGDTILGDSLVPLVIPAYDLGENAVYLMKTPHEQRLIYDWKMPMWQVGMATAAAPTFFPAYSLPDKHVRLIDGGVWANNPSMVGVVEAVSMFGQPLDSIKVLSLGTTVDRQTRPRHLDNGGVLQWVRSPNVAQVFLSGQSAGAFAQVEQLLGKASAFRLNPPAPEGLVRLDVADSRDLIAKAAHYGRKLSAIFTANFSDHLRSPYQPLYT